MAYVLFKSNIGTASNQTLPVLINQLVPIGLKGFFSAAVLAALMSAVSAALNSCGTLVAVDIYKRIWPQTDDRKQVRVGRISSVVVMLLAMLWSTQGGKYSRIFEGINAIGSNLAPPITTVFLFGVFWRRGTKEASLSTLIFGFLLGTVMFILDFPVFGSEKILTDGLGIPFLMQAWYSFCICSLFYVIVSLCTPPPSCEQVDGLTWRNPLSVIVHGPLVKGADPRIVAGLLLVTLGVLYYFFA